MQLYISRQEACPVP